MVAISVFAQRQIYHVLSKIEQTKAPIPHMQMVRIRFIAAAMCLCLSSCLTKSPTPEGFTLHPDFTLQLVASEPIVRDPVQMEFDQYGQAYVLQFPGYPHGDQEGSIVRLVDENQDGHYESGSTFAENLSLASSFMAWKDGFLVAAVPDLLFIRDSDGDQVADEREVLISGFEVGNQQHNVNGLIYSHDNCILVANGYNGGKVHWADTPEDSQNMRGHDLKIDLLNHTMELLGRTSGGHEIAIDAGGHIFVTHNTDYLQHIVFPKHYLPKHKTDPPHVLEDIGLYEENGLGRIYPIGAQVSRVNHPEQAGYFSGACGIFHYGGGVFPADFDGNIFVADVVTNLIHRNRIEDHHESFRGRRVREDVEFLASTDRQFRPVTMNSGPDGSMYIVDMHREIIEHPEWIPDKLEQEMDLTAGMDQGRIYRITPKTPSGKPFQNFAALADEPINFLGHPNQWVRTTAQRLVVTGEQENNLERLVEMAGDLTNELQCLHALWCLQGLQKLDEDLIIAATQSDNPIIVESALQLADGLTPSAQLLNREIALLEHPHPRVRMQAVLTAGHALHENIKLNPAVIQPLKALMIKDISRPYTRLALQTLPLPIQSQLLVTLWNIQEGSQGREDLISIMTRTQFAAASHEELERLLVQKNLPSDALALSATLRGLQDYLSGPTLEKKTINAIVPTLVLSEETGDLTLLATASKLRKELELPLSPAFRKMSKASREIVLDQTAATELRVAHLDLLALSDKDLSETYREILTAVSPPALQIAVMKHLEDGKTAEKVPEILCARWSELGPRAKQLAGDILLYTKYYQKDLLTAFEDGTISLGEMNMHLERRRQLLFSDDPEIKSRAEALFDDSGILQRAEAIEAMMPMVDLEGVTQAGESLYISLCSQCHQIGSTGHEVGPDLSGSYHKSKEALLHDIVDPNSGCETSYLSYLVRTTDGNTYSGIVSNDDSDGVTLILQGGAEKHIPRSQIKDMKTSGISFMPEGLEASMSQQDMADLVAFLQAVER